VLDANGKLLKLVLKMANNAGGTAEGTLISVDQGGVEIPVTAIMQKATNLKLELQSIAGSFDGDLQEGEIRGQWTQGPATLPLTFKKRK
jgi:hypothetical protein